MGGPTLIQLVAWASTGACVLGAMWLLWFARFRDKDRDKARCPKCWYELGTLASPPALPVTCPECGKKVETLRQLQRRRLRRLPILAAFPVLLGAWVCWELPQIDQRGWLWLVPNRVLFEVYPLVSPMSDMSQQLHMRLGLSSWSNGSTLRTLDEADVNAFVSRCARGNWFAPQMSETWRETYGQLLHGAMLPIPEAPCGNPAIGPARVSLSTSIDDIISIPCEFSIHTRERWPTTVVPDQLVRIEHRAWWPLGWVTEGILEWSATNHLGETARGHSTYEMLKTKVTIPLTGEVRVDATLKLYKLPHPSAPGEKRLLTSHAFQWRYASVATLNDAFTPVIDHRIDEALKAARFSIEHTRLVVDLDDLAGAPTDGVTFSVRMQLSVGNRVIGTGKAVWIGANRRIGLYFDTTAPEAASLMAGIIPPGLTLTLTSDPSLAIQTQTTDRLWKGDVTIPLASGPVIDPYAPANPPPGGK